MEKGEVVKEGWNGYNVLHDAASRVAALDLGFLPSAQARLQIVLHSVAVTAAVVISAAHVHESAHGRCSLVVLQRKRARRRCIPLGCHAPHQYDAAARHSHMVRRPGQRTRRPQCTSSARTTSLTKTCGRAPL